MNTFIRMTLVALVICTLPACSILSDPAFAQAISDPSFQQQLTDSTTQLTCTSALSGCLKGCHGNGACANQCAASYSCN
jgi:hypothetical protein